jgi:hypothetical protein
MAVTLDCGCHIYEGKRTWCPTCAGNGPTAREAALAAENDKLRVRLKAKAAALNELGEALILSGDNAIDLETLLNERAKLRAAVRDALDHMPSQGSLDGLHYATSEWIAEHAEAIALSKEGT